MPTGYKLTQSDYYKLADKKGIKWLGPWVKNNQTKTHWECKEGHKWQATYASIYQKGMGCRQCYENSLRLTDDDYHNLARDNEFQWLGPQVKKNTQKTHWRCVKGHIFENTYSSIQMGHGCIQCRNDKLRLTPADYRNLAYARGYKWLGPQVQRNYNLTKWQCYCGNVWEANYNNISRGRSCPKCRNVINGAQVSEAQIKLSHMVSGELNYRIEDYYADVLVIRDGKKIAIEYDTWYWHGHKVEEDKRRAKEIIKAGYKVLSIKSNVQLPDDTQLDTAIEILLEGKDYLEIILEDWGKGSLAIDVL